MTREERSIKFLQVSEPKRMYHLAFSGGGDSQTVYDLCKKAGVAFRAYFCRTSVDPPEIIDFIKTDYPDVIFLKPKRTMYQSILANKILPLRTTRFCCVDLKEYAGKGEVVLTGIRSAESTPRKSRQTVEYDKQKMKIFIHPIKDWSNRQVLNYLKRNNIKRNILYAEGFSRIGCIGCPNASPNDRQRIFQRYPMHKVAYINTIQKMMDSGLHQQFENAEDMFNWWISDLAEETYFERKKQGEFNFV